VARARDVPGFDCEETFSASAERVVAVRAAEVFEHSDGVLDMDDIEPVHDMRVATRRLRAALEIFESCFPAKRHRKALKRVKALADALGERRDRDVAIKFLEGFAAEVPDADRVALIALIERLSREQQQANDELAPYVAPKRLKRLRRRLRKLVKAAGGMKPRDVDDLDPPAPLRPNAARIVRTRLEELRSFAPAALEPSAATAQHDMRIAAKRLRYVLEIAGPCFGPEAKAARDAARRLQSVLGDIHDCDVMLPQAERVESLCDLLRTRRELLFRHFAALWQEELDEGIWAALERALH
jgi:CHAD domain-containing protein